MGLTPLQARSYFALVNIGTSEARSISAASQISRQDIYRVLNELENLGLAKRILSAPVKFEALPIEEAAVVLAEKRKTELSEMEKDLTGLKENLIGLSKVLQKETPQTSKLPVIVKMNEIELSQELSATHEHLDLAMNFGESATFFYKHDAIFKEFFENAVVTRLLIGEVKNKNIAQTWQIGEFLAIAKDAAQIRQTPARIPVEVSIHDNKRVFIHIYRSRHKGDYTTLRSDNQELLVLSRNYFENLWKNTQTPTPKP
jgi:sugar-specific transcriptional regulator TrmB